MQFCDNAFDILTGWSFILSCVIHWICHFSITLCSRSIDYMKLSLVLFLCIHVALSQKFCSVCQAIVTWVILIVSLSIYHDQAKCQAYNACSHVSKSQTAAISFSLAKKIIKSVLLKKIIPEKKRRFFYNKICFIKKKKTYLKKTKNKLN